MSGVLDAVGDAAGGLGSVNNPAVITTDPTPPALVPLQYQLAQRMSQLLNQGYPAMQNPYPGVADPFSQLYGPGAGGGWPQWPGGGGGQRPDVYTMLHNFLQNRPQFTGVGTGGSWLDDFLQNRPESRTELGGPGIGAAPGSGTGGNTLNSYTPSYVNQTTQGGAQNGGAAPARTNTPLGEFDFDDILDAAIGGGGGGAAPFNGPLNTGFDLPMWGGPYSAPLTGGQMNALSGMQQIFDPSQVVTNNQMRDAITAGISGGEIFNPSTMGNLRNATRPYDARSGTQTGLVDSIINRSDARFGEDVLNRDLDRVVAQTRGEASAFGLNPGAADRTRTTIEAAGDVINRFRLGQQQAGTQNLLNLLPSVQAGDQSAVNNFLDIRNPAADRANQFAAMLPQFSNLPFQQAQAVYGLNELARQVPDMALQRMMSEYGRTQGGGLNQIYGLFGNSFPQSTNIGPSPLSQFGQIGLGLGMFAL